MGVSKIVQSAGLTIVYTGGGKGKTTAALGMALRAVGRDMKVAIIQFIKAGAGKWEYGELKSIKRLAPEVELIPTGKGFVGIIDDKLPKSEHVKAAKETLRISEEKIRSDSYDIVILDEINYAYNLKLIKEADILNLIDSKPKRLNLVLTGNHAPQSVIDKADLVTEMKEIKHPFQKGIPAKKGIDF